MPKIRDLGINVIPETMRPPEIGGGGGCGQGSAQTASPGICPTQGSLNCYAMAGTASPICATQPSANCGAYMVYTSPDPRCPYRDTYLCTMNCPHGYTQMAAGTASPICATQPSVNCGYYAYGPGAGWTTSPHCPTQPTVNCYAEVAAGTASPLCVTQQTGNCAQYALTLDAINQLKQQLQAQIEQLDQVAASMGPKTAEEIDAREKELRAELDDLANRRAQLQNDQK